MSPKLYYLSPPCLVLLEAAGCSVGEQHAVRTSHYRPDGRDFRDRVHVHEPMQKIVTDRLRPAGSNDYIGVEQAKVQLREAYPVLERELDARAWMLGDAFILADCAAAPALFYAYTVIPFEDKQKNLTAYMDRLIEQPSFERVLIEADPYFASQGGS